MACWAAAQEFRLYICESTGITESVKNDSIAKSGSSNRQVSASVGEAGTTRGTGVGVFVAPTMWHTSIFINYLMSFGECRVSDLSVNTSA
jgi:hypothetical protein